MPDPNGLRKLVADRDRRYNTPRQLRATSREIAGRVICLSCGKVETYDDDGDWPIYSRPRKCSCGGKRVAVWG